MLDRDKKWRDQDMKKILNLIYLVIALNLIYLDDLIFFILYANSYVILLV